MSVINEPLRNWVVKLVGDITSQGAITRFVLSIGVDGGYGEPIEVWHLDGNDPEEVAGWIWQKAEEDAETRGRGARLRYVVLAYRNDANGNPKSEHDSSMPFVLHGRSGGDNVYNGNTVAATAAGELGQRLQHDSDLHRLLFSQTEMLTSRYAQDIDRERKLRIIAEDRQFDLMKLREELLDRKADRELHSATELMKSKQLTDGISAFIAILPLIAAKFLGGTNGITGNSEAALARDMTIGKLIKNMSQDEFLKVLQILSPEKQLGLLELAKSYKEDDAREQASRPPLLRDGTPGDDKTPGKVH